MGIVAASFISCWNDTPDKSTSSSSNHYALDIFSRAVIAISSLSVFWQPLELAEFFAVEEHVVIAHMYIRPIAQDRFSGAAEHASFWNNTDVTAFLASAQLVQD